MEFAGASAKLGYVLTGESQRYSRRRGVLVGVNDETCYNCGRRNPGLWGYAPALRRLGQDLGFVPLVIGGTIVLYALSLLLSGAGIQGVADGRERLPNPGVVADDALLQRHVEVDAYEHAPALQI